MPNHSLNTPLTGACHRLSREVRARPLLTLSVAVGVGAVVGALVGGAGSRGRKTWLAEMGSALGGHVDEAGDRALRTSHRAGQGLRAAAHRATDVVPELDLDRLARQGRHWLRARLS